MKAGKPNRRAGTATLTAGCTLCVMTPTLALILIQTPPVYASQSVQETRAEEVTFNPEESPNASTNSKVIGHIRVELISVIMPTGGLESQVDTKTPFRVDNPGAQIQSLEVQIRNLSVAPVKLETPQVAEIGDEDVKFSEKLSDQVEQSPQPVDRISSVGASGTAILVLGEGNRRYNEASFEKDVIMPGKKNIFITDIPAEEARTLKLYGKVASDFCGEYQFAVHPTLRISAIQADPSDWDRNARKQK